MMRHAPFLTKLFPDMRALYRKEPVNHTQAPYGTALGLPSEDAYRRNHIIKIADVCTSRYKIVYRRHNFATYGVFILV